MGEIRSQLHDNRYTAGAVGSANSRTRTINTTSYPKVVKLLYSTDALSITQNPTPN